MKKHINFSFLLLFFLCLIFISCSKNDKYKNSIPKNSSIVVIVDLKSLIEKAGTKDFNKTNLYNFLLNSIPPNNEKKSLFEKIIREPELTGIDFEKDAFYFRIDDKEMDCFLIKLKSYSKFQTMLQDLLKDKMPNIEETDDYYYIQPSKKDIIGWDYEKVIVIHTDQLLYKDSIKNYLSEYMKSDMNNSIFNDNDFAEYYKNKKDINLWLALDGISNKKDYNESKFDSVLSSDLMKGSKFYANLDFTNGEIKLTGRTIIGEKLSQKFDFNNLLKDGLSDNIMKMAPPKALAYISYALDLKKFLEFMSNLIGENILDMPLNENYKVNALTNIFSGEFLICLNDFSRKITSVENSFFGSFDAQPYYDTTFVPVISIYASIKDTNEFSNILKSLQLPFVFTGNYYELETGKNDRIYIGFKNKVMIFAFNKEIIERSFVAQPKLDAFMQHTYANTFMNNTTALYINLDYNQFSEGTREFLKNVTGDFSSIIPYIEFYDSFIYYATKDNKFSAVIKMKDSSQNSLYKIFHNLDKNIKLN